MTSTTGTDGHPEVAEISALAEGVLTPSRSADVREHLADCELCKDVRNSLSEIRDLLGTLPGPPRMPADIAGRIDAALAAEALLDATAPRPGDDVSRETAPGEHWPEPIPVSRETGSETGSPVSRETGDRPAGRPRAATGPGRQTPAPRRRRIRRGPAVLLGTACAAAVIGLGSLFLYGGSDGTSRTSAGASGGSRPPAGFSEQELTVRVQDLLRSSSASVEPRGMSAQNSPETLRDNGSTAPSCVREGIGRPESALATRPEKYREQDAYLVVLPHPGNAALVDAYVVSAACESSASPAPGQVLLDRTVPRP
ncbi:anti-sigma factor family protein [Streptomyces sp. NPDC001404]|uniref:anti-sigma factor family protein n=1 Tax=Streptomyces sp. NPDC001404 TaxID=3364571 RepID=UPI003697E02E